ncbi:MAG: SMP-30/gluconolactonase/LRE family protein [Terriglobales bacterium]
MKQFGNASKVALLLLAAALPAVAQKFPTQQFDRGKVSNFATIPTFVPSGPGAACPGGAASCTSDVEGITVDPDGTVYSPSFGFNSEGGLSGYGELFVFSPHGKLVKHFPVTGSSPHLIGLVYQQSSSSVLIADLGSGKVWKVDPASETTSCFMLAPTITTSPGLNALTIDMAGNVYVSDSFQGAIWKTGPEGLPCTSATPPEAWYAPPPISAQNDLLLPTPNAGELLVPPFGANGLEFNNEQTALFVMNTAYHSIVKIPVNTDGSAGTGVTLTTGINAPDGVAVDADDNLWVAANQGDEIVVVNPNGMLVAKKGDFYGISDDGSIQGLVFPASLVFSPDHRRLYVTNLALYLPYAGVPEIAVDSGWTLKVKHYNIAVIEIPHWQ